MIGDTVDVSHFACRGVIALWENPSPMVHKSLTLTRHQGGHVAQANESDSSRAFLFQWKLAWSLFMSWRSWVWNFSQPHHIPSPHRQHPHPHSLISSGKEWSQHVRCHVEKPRTGWLMDDICIVDSVLSTSPAQSTLLPWFWYLNQ